MVHPYVCVCFAFQMERAMETFYTTDRDLDEAMERAIHHHFLLEMKNLAGL